MSLLEPAEPRTKDVTNTPGAKIKCRIPQRLPTTRQRMVNRTAKFPANSESMPPQPKTANKTKDDGPPAFRQAHTRPARQDRLLPRITYCPAQRVSTLPKRIPNERMASTMKSGRPVITVPAQKQLKGFHITKNYVGLPDQETIEKREELEIKHSEISDAAHNICDFYDQESITSENDKVVALKINWQETKFQFEKMKSDLVERQKLITELYASMRDTHQKMLELGHNTTTLPPIDDLTLMNVSNLTPEQLLQVCGNTYTREIPDTETLSKNVMSVDVNKIYNMSSKLVETCDQTLVKAKEMIDWFDTLKTKQKAVTIDVLTRKLNEFNAGNKAMNCDLNRYKCEFYHELNDIIEMLRKGVNETIALHLRTEELNSINSDLRKQLNNAEHHKLQMNKKKIEDLEKKLKEEKDKTSILKGKLSRSEGQSRSFSERTTQLEGALEQAQKRTRSLERTKQQLHDQNDKLQFECKEFQEMTDSMAENIAHWKNIAEDRDKLAAEKQMLEKCLNDLSENYSESLLKLKTETDRNVSKILDTEQKYKEAIEETKKFEEKIASLCAQLLESDLRCKDLSNELKDRETQISKMLNDQHEFDICKRNLDIANAEIEDCNTRLTQQKEVIKEIERNFNETLNLEKSLKRELTTKDEYVTQLEKNQSLLEKQLKESERKMCSYEEQLALLKKNLNKLQDYFGECGNVDELLEMINQQRAQLLEATRQNGELAEALQNKDEDLARTLTNLSKQKQLLEERDGIIKLISEKADQQENYIIALRNNIEMRSQADITLNQQLTEKNNEIDLLITTLNARNQQISESKKIVSTLEDQVRKGNVQISQLEKIILSLEEQTQKDGKRKQMDQNKITVLENKIQEYELYDMKHTSSLDSSADNLDNLIKILENELGMPLNAPLSTIEQNLIAKRKPNSLSADHKEPHKPVLCYSDPETTMPSKKGMEKFINDSHLSSNEEKFKGDNLGRKKAITNINPETFPDIEAGMCNEPDLNKDKFQRFKNVNQTELANDIIITKNLRYLIHDQPHGDKKCKMLKLAGHKL